MAVGCKNVELGNSAVTSVNPEVSSASNSYRNPRMQSDDPGLLFSQLAGIPAKSLRDLC